MYKTDPVQTQRGGEEEWLDVVTVNGARAVDGLAQAHLGSSLAVFNAGPDAERAGATVAEASSGKLVTRLFLCATPAPLLDSPPLERGVDAH